MCGIAGIINFNGNPINDNEIRLMTDSISHRGPDGEGIWINSDNTVGLGHRRLSIIDLSIEANQPMHFLDRYTIVFNGEIYNYIEIREHLEILGYNFKTNSDTEVLLALFDNKKEKCLNDLDGMFSFVIWDNFEKKIFAARDRFGEKPFYFSFHNGRFYFASEMKALWKIGVPKDIDNEMIFNFLEFNLVHNLKDVSKTFFKNIFKLKSSHYLYFNVIGSDFFTPSPKRYWSIKNSIIKDEYVLDDKLIQERFYNLFKTSVERRLRSDVPVGSSLSGGLDSSSIVCMIDKLSKSVSQNTFSAVFPGFERDESKFIEKVISTTSVKPYFVEPNLPGMLDNFEKLLHHQEEPFGSSSIYAQFCVMSLAKDNGVTVLLDGQGADEILGGYHYYYHSLERESTNEMFNSKNSSFKINEGYSFKQNSIQFIKSHFPFLVPLYRKINRPKLSNYDGPYNREFYQIYSKFDIGFPDHKSLNDHLIYDLVEGNLENLLRFADRNSMAFSREVRLPYLSHELCEFVASLPSNFKIRDNWTKWLQRTSLSNLMPSDIVWRKDKIGYEPPQQLWMENKYFKDFTMESKNVLYKNGIISKLESEKLPSEYSAFNRGDNSWNYMMAGNLFKS